MNNYVLVIMNNRKNEVTCITEDDLKNYYTSDFELEDLFDNYFRVSSEKLDIWNKFVQDKWSCLDDAYYYRYNSPELEREQCNTWLCYDLNDNVSTVKEYREKMLRHLSTIEKDMNFLDNFKF